jgi:hypothetical protein
MIGINVIERESSSGAVSLQRAGKGGSRYEVRCEAHPGDG